MEYEIVMVERVTFLDARNNPVDGYRITFQIADTGITDWVDVPERLYEREYVEQQIVAKLERHSKMLGWVA